MFHNKEDLMVGSLQTKTVRTHLRNANLWAQLQVRFQADHCKDILFHYSCKLYPTLYKMSQREIALFCMYLTQHVCPFLRLVEPTKLETLFQILALTGHGQLEYCEYSSRNIFCYIRYLNILAAEKSPSDISIGSHVSQSSRGSSEVCILAAISF